MIQSRRSLLWRNQSYLPFLIKQMETINHATEPYTVGHVISERHWKSDFDFIEIVNNYGLKRGTVWQILGFIYAYNFENIFTA